MAGFWGPKSQRTPFSEMPNKVYSRIFPKLPGEPSDAMRR